MDQEVNRKIKQCRELMANAISPKQRTIYRGYLQFWQEKITKSNQKTDTETGEGFSTPPTKEINPIIEGLIVAIREKEFKHKFPNKNAYYTRDGITHKTKAFKEFLISNQ